MSQFEYRVIPAPTRGEKARDAKTPSDRYSVALTGELNRMARDGWEYVRADVLPSEERSGLTGRSTVYHNLLVFRRTISTPAAAAIARPPQPEYPAAASPAREPEPLPVLPQAAAPLQSNHPVASPPAKSPSPDDDAMPPPPRAAPAQT
ncbi:DUF4177 domain-containing protein [Paracoccus sediminis]|uniref:DUF4177 domain-containing protein n=1 Tax=Paracoccus sediminis TaxID=1214787 RepID=A0A238US82_9RHOB|nr:DUF4177 domain-containing protein [Paracoccus sediminis]SNR24527.1 hypothetical protein SAMN06265378_101319 [Paracoccus sediminis]